MSQEVASLNSRFSERRAVLKRHAFRAGPYSERDDEMGNGAAAEEPEQTLEEVEKGSSIRVVAGDGINLQLNAKVDHSPALVYEVRGRRARVLQSAGQRRHTRCDGVPRQGAPRVAHTSAPCH